MVLRFNISKITKISDTDKNLTFRKIHKKKNRLTFLVSPFTRFLKLLKMIFLLLDFGQFRCQSIQLHKIAEMLAVELVGSHNLLANVDFGGELSAEKRFFKSVTFDFLIVLGNNLRQNIVVVLERWDGFNNLVIVFHYTHSCILLSFIVQHRG